MTDLRELLQDGEHHRNEAEEMERQAAWHRHNFRLQDAEIAQHRAALHRESIPAIARTTL